MMLNNPTNYFAKISLVFSKQIKSDLNSNLYFLYFKNRIVLQPTIQLKVNFFLLV